MTIATFILIVGLVILFIGPDAVQAVCKFPKYYDGSWYHRGSGKDTDVQIKPAELKWVDNQGGDRKCRESYMHPKQEKSEGANYTMLLQSGDSCFICIDIVYRSPYILQFREDSCTTTPDITQCDGYTKLPAQNEMVTMFKITSPSMNCIDSIEGLFQFSYEVNTGGGGICNDTRNILQACQTPGSPNYDNKDFVMNYNRCPDVSTSFKATIRFKCMGSWTSYINGQVYTYVGLKDDSTGVQQDQFKCLMTLRDQKSVDNSISWGMTRFGDCRDLKSLQSSPIRIVLRRIAPQTKYMQPQCSLPGNITGTWFTQGLQFASDVTINSSHIYYRTMLSQFDYEETWFSCQANLGTRYLMTKVVVGRCEVSLTCFDLAPRHQGIIRYRVGRSTKLSYNAENQPRSERFLSDAFMETCSWQWLTFARENVDWKYEVLIQNPPSPVTCPMGGRWTFNQRSHDFYQMYDTRIRGGTLSPRNQISCDRNVSEIKSCHADRSKLEIDAWYCETVDFSGKPIGEYDEPDHTLTCVGFWLEDMRSYLITYDEEDAVSQYRCWVYERISWTQLVMSRSETARCPKQQTAYSYTTDGARFVMELTEAERLFDDCPQRFDAGMVVMKPITLYRLFDGSASSLQPHLGIMVVVTTTLVSLMS